MAEVKQLTYAEYEARYNHLVDRLRDIHMRAIEAKEAVAEGEYFRAFDRLCRIEHLSE